MRIEVELRVKFNTKFQKFSLTVLYFFLFSIVKLTSVRAIKKVALARVGFHLIIIKLLKEGF